MMIISHDFNRKGVLKSIHYNGMVIFTQQIEFKTFFQRDGVGPTKVLNLGTFGKVPLHTLSEFHITTHDDQILTLHQAKASRSIGGWVGTVEIF